MRLLGLIRSAFKSGLTVEKIQKPCQLCNTCSRSRYSSLGPSKKAYARDKPHINVGTIGHVDHGKTTLTSAITRVLSKHQRATFKKYEEIDNAPQEQARGITINSVFVDYETEKRHYGHIDCPGHADYVKNMISGTSQMDSCILVVAATDGCMPQTREHLLLAKQIGLPRMVVYLNKADVADEEMLELVEMEMKELLEEYGYDGNTTPMIKGSALKALQDTEPELGEQSILKLLDALDSYIPTPERDSDRPFYMSVRATYQLQGRGVAVAGRLERGSLERGEKCVLMGFDKMINTHIVGVEAFKKSVDKAVAGDQLGVLLRGLKKGEAKRGMILTKPGSAKLYNHIETQIYFLSPNEGGRKKPFTTNIQTQMFSKTWDVAVKFNVRGAEMVMPGESGIVQLIMQKQMVVEAGQHFTIRGNEGTYGYGIISKCLDNIDSEDAKKLF